MEAEPGKSDRPLGGAPVWMFVVLLLAMAVYLPGLPGEFMFDDHWNILQNQELKIDSLDAESLREAGGSGRAGPLKRPLAMLSFGLNYYFAGENPGPYKWFNLFLHLLNGLLVFFLARCLLQSSSVSSDPGHQPRRVELVACLAAALWLIHPLNLTSVLYIVQRMTLLASLFTLLSLYLYASGRQAIQQGGAGAGRMLCAVLLCLPLAALSKEIGLLIPAYLLVIEATLYQRTGLEIASRRFLYLYHAVFCLLPALLVAGYFLVNPDFILAGYAGRDFSLPDRLLTQARVLWFYLRLVLVPDVSTLALFHDDFALSRGLFAPWTTGLAVLGWVAVLCVLAATRRRFPLLVCALAFYLVGHAMESSVFSLEMVHEHRNYVPQLGLLICLAWYLLGREVPRARLGAALAVVALAWFGVTTTLRALAWSDLASFSVAQYQHHPESARSNYQMGRIYAMRVSAIEDAELRNRYFDEAQKHFFKASELQSHFADGLFGLLVLYATNDQPTPEGVTRELQRRLREERFQVNSINQINSLVRCQAVGACALDPALVNAVLAAARENPTLGPQLKSLLPQNLPGPAPG